ncbi:MAG: GspH/FimT family pseudopilin [Gemmatimonadetes bacterium]|nr:GspH/FimT family pseudopilin [Gemmatimonadota bacterium]
MSTCARATRRGPAGFTLAELLIVLVIVAIALSMAVPKLNAFLQVNAVQGALNRVATDLNLARVRALTTSRQVRLTVAADGGSYTVVVDPAGAAPVTYKTVRLTQDFPGVDLTPHSTAITFDSRGMATGANGTTTLTATKQGKSGTLTVSGVGRIYRGY